MPSEPRNMPEQERSIKARAHELFVEPPQTGGQVKPFPVYLRETPAVPMSATIKALLWMVGIIVALLFIGAVWRLMVRHGPRRPGGPARRAADTRALLPLCDRSGSDSRRATGLARNGGAESPSGVPSDA